MRCPNCKEPLPPRCIRCCCGEWLGEWKEQENMKQARGVMIHLGPSITCGSCKERLYLDRLKDVSDSAKCPRCNKPLYVDEPENEEPEPEYEAETQYLERLKEENMMICVACGKEVAASERCPDCNSYQAMGKGRVECSCGGVWPNRQRQCPKCKKVLPAGKDRAAENKPVQEAKAKPVEVQPVKPQPVETAKPEPVQPALKISELLGLPIPEDESYWEVQTQLAKFLDYVPDQPEPQFTLASKIDTMKQVVSRYETLKQLLNK